MKRLPKQLRAGLIVLSSALLGASAPVSQTGSAEPKPVVLSVQWEHMRPVYKLNGKTVEDRIENSILNNLMRVANDQGSETPVFVVADERAPFTEVNKLRTALDKIDMPNRRLFIADFPAGTMNEIHWEEPAVPIPNH